MLDAKSMFYENKSNVLRMEFVVPFLPQFSLYTLKLQYYIILYFENYRCLSAEEIYNISKIIDL